ncbi:MAG: DUF4124 domain-containing protein [Bdellovibrionota bacterium]
MRAWGLAKLLGFFFVFLLAGGHTALAAMYKYKDDKGHVHFVDSLHKVPPEYRNQVDPNYVPHSQPAEEPAAKARPLPPAPPGGAAADKGAKLDSLKETRRKGCDERRAQLEKRMADTMRRYEEWKKKKKSEDEQQTTDLSGGWTLCESGDAEACLKSRRELEAQREEETARSSPYWSQLQTLDVQAQQLKRECGE